MKDDSRFWDRIANKYYRSPIKDVGAYEEKLKISRTYLKPEATALEFGCGTGGTAIAHAPYVEHIHAIDLSEKMLEFARAQAKRKKVHNVTFEKTSIESFTAPTNSFDVIFGLSILHLIENRDAVLEKVFQLLKPGGVFISSTACIGDTIAVFKYIAPIGRAIGVFPIVKVFKEEQLVSELNSTGFKVLQQWRPKNNMAAFIVAKREPIEAGRFGEFSDAKKATNTDAPIRFAI